MIAAKAGVNAVDALERIDESGRRQISRRQPSAEIGESPGGDCEDDTDQCESRHRAGKAQALALPANRRFNAGRHSPSWP